MGKIPTILVIAILVPLTLFAVFQNQDLRRAAFGKRANIVIDASRPGARISANLWQNFAQGGEEPKNMLAPVAKQVKNLNPKIIRIDHIFDYYVKINPAAAGQVNYDFSALDEVVKTILETGARPMFSISYMPSQLTSKSSVSPPSDWSQWRCLVSALVTHYSGRNDYNINNVYYEVWNEPDLFGRWRYNKNPNYLTLYYHTAAAAQSAVNANPFKIGGPATTGFYPNWIKALLKFCHQNRLRIDFVSWHRYAKNLEVYQSDFEKLNKILTNYPKYFSLERLITEFGPDSENSPWYNNQISAIHSIASAVKLLGKVHRVFAFEIKDGPNKIHNWGLITHENIGGKPKPRYYAYQFLNQLTGNRLPLEGEGSWVTGAAAQNGRGIKVLIVNYDQANRHFEAPTITLKNITPGSYVFHQKYFLGKTTTNQETINGASVTKKIILEPNSAAILEWRLIAPSKK